MFDRGMTGMKGFIDCSGDFRNAKSAQGLYEKETIHIQGDARRILANKTADEIIRVARPGTAR